MSDLRSINTYIDETFVENDEVLAEVIASIEAEGMPSISVSASSGKLLTLLIAISGARNVLEIGALGGYSGICLARGFGEDGSLTSLELEARYAELAHSNLAKAGFGNQVSYMTGPALDSLAELERSDKRFDFFFIDADKENYPNYLEGCLKIAEPGAVILSDNVLARGTVADNTMEPTKNTEVMKAYNQSVAGHPRLESILIPLGDGVTLARVKG
ncbi:O-methyltransferase [Planomicrobium sp. YIM 101495]|uniref:O-methyltransferase n=1 Tax=Planomicrobium sp. YIM 101495 TaxID=2665160 RepID=UPI0012B91FB6|nr:O-methyltransferase [Planomicrobium sp. YIM 101495]MTD31722.1 O-methyltransferase [Planomicrobium sp. YIM 101495]